MTKKIKIPILVVLGVIVGILSYQMWNLPLWGYRPLFLFLAFWAFVVIALESRFSSLPSNRKLIGWSTLAGVLLALGFPVSPLTPLMFIGFVPLLMVEKVLADSREAPSKWAFFKYSYHTFVVWNIITTFWVANSASFVASVIAIWLNAAFMAIPMILFHQTRKMMNRDFMYLAFIVNWISWEFMHLRWEISWPWLTLGNSFAEYPSWVQWYEYTGVFGGTFWILLTNLLIFRWIAKPRFLNKERTEITAYLKIVALVLLPIAISLGIYYNYEEKGKSVETVVIQPNYEPHYQKFTIPGSEQLDRFLELSREALTPNTEYLVFPETSFNRIERGQMERTTILRELHKLTDEYPNLKLVTGIASYKIFKEGEPLGAAVRTQKDRNGKELTYEIYNAGIQLESGKKEVQFYKKSKLVPGAEITPYNKIFFFLKPIIDELGGSLAGHGMQKKRTPFSSNSGNVAPVICYESIYGEYVTGYIKEGANAIFIMTNDGWWDDTPGYKQHLKFASLRAIETRRDIARSANTGTSCFINQRGDIRQATAYEVATAIKGDIRLNTEETAYVKWGDMIGRLSIFTFFLLLVNTFAKGKMKEATGGG